MNAVPLCTSSGLFFIILLWLNPFALGPSPVVLTWLLSWGTYAGLMFMLGLRPSRQHWARNNASAWLIAATLSALIALLQYFHAADNLQPWVSPSDGVAFANLRQRNQFATLTLIGFSALLWFCQTQKGRWMAWSAGAASMLLIAGNAASTSRTGMVGLVIIAAMVWLWRRSLAPLVKRVVLFSLPLYAVFSILLPALSGHPGSFGALTRLAEGDALCGSRLTLWSNVLHLIAQKPWFGWGWGELDYAHYATLYPGPRFCDILDNAHNLPLHLAVELGVPVAVAFCAMILWLVLRAKPWAETNATRQMAWLVLTVIGWHSLLEYPLWYGPFQMTVLLCVGLLCMTPRNSATDSLSDFQWKNPQTPVLVAMAAMVLLAATGYAAWDYHRISQIYLQPAARSTAYRDDTFNKIKDSWLFHAQVQFAALSTTPLTLANAPEQYRMATALLHFSPEARVIERVIESALILHRDDEVAFHMARYRAAFPAVYAAWVKRQG